MPAGADASNAETLSNQPNRPYTIQGTTQFFIDHSSGFTINSQVDASHSHLETSLPAFNPKPDTVLGRIISIAAHCSQMNEGYQLFKSAFLQIVRMFFPDRDNFILLLSVIFIFALGSHLNNSPSPKQPLLHGTEASFQEPAFEPPAQRGTVAPPLAVAPAAPPRPLPPTDDSDSAPVKSLPTPKPPQQAAQSPLGKTSPDKPKQQAARDDLLALIPDNKNIRFTDINKLGRPATPAPNKAKNNRQPSKEAASPFDGFTFFDD